jgi:putative peptidoglycan lipid II flippase
MLNIVMIGSVLILAPLMGRSLQEQIYGLAIGVVLAGMVQAFFQLPSLRREGFRYRWERPWKDPVVREVVRKMIPGSIGVAAFQINVILTQSFAFWFDPTIVATFNYAVRLMELPQGLFGISLATYLLPTLSGLAAEKNYPEFRATLRQGLSHLAVTNLLAAAVSLSLAVPIVRLLFERGIFGSDATSRVAVALACLAPGLVMFSMNNIFARAYYALEDIKTPMKISLLCLMLNLLFSVWLVQRYREAGLAVANTLTAGLNLGLLSYGLRRKLGKLEMAGLTRSLLVLVPAAAFSGWVAWLVYGWCDGEFGHSTTWSRVLAVFLPGTLAGVLYLVLGYAGGVPSVREMVGLIRSKVLGRD